MKKISTLFKKDSTNLGRVINEINPDNAWVLDGEGIATWKRDGTAAAIINGEIYKRYDVKKGRSAPMGAIPCQEADPISGHHPHWVKCDRANKEDRYFFEGYDNYPGLPDGTYELIGEKVQGNPERIKGHRLIWHGSEVLSIEDLSFDGLREYLSNPVNDIEGIVFHHVSGDGRMCKIRKSDFGVKR